MAIRRKLWIWLGVLAVAGGVYGVATRVNLNVRYRPGDVLDRLDGVAIHYNGGIHMTHGRHLAPDGYNLGIRYQCVEFVKRYYYERHGHRMPDAYGHAKDFFDASLADGQWNARRGMAQYVNGGMTRPAAGDLIVFRPWLFNRYGHVAIVASVSNDSLEIAQQNPGPWGKTRAVYPLTVKDNCWFVEHRRVPGWLRLPPAPDSPGEQSAP